MESYGLKRAGWDRLRSRIGGFEGCRTVVGVGCRIGPLREKRMTRGMVGMERWRRG